MAEKILKQGFTGTNFYRYVKWILLFTALLLMCFSAHPVIVRIGATFMLFSLLEGRR